MQQEAGGTLVGRRTGPLTLRCFSLAPRIRSPDTAGGTHRHISLLSYTWVSRRVNAPFSSDCSALHTTGYTQGTHPEGRGPKAL